MRTDTGPRSRRRAACRGVLERPTDAEVREALNDVLAAGHIRRWLGEDGPSETVEVDEARFPGWVAAASLLDLLERDATRVRRCANPDCVLYFHDTSKSGKRRWCSMETCGNRAKARRHYDRQRSTGKT